MRNVLKIYLVPFYLGWIAALLSLAAHAETAVTKHADMASQLRRDCAENPDTLHLYTIGVAAVSKKPIYLVRVTDEPSGASPTNSPRLLVICRQHGDEPVNTQAALRWLAECASLSGAELTQRLGPVTVYIVPMANPDGADKLNRFTGASGDMNRDWGPFLLPETRALYAASKQIAPDAVIDMHSWDMTDPFQANSVEAGMVAGAANTQQARAAVSLQNEIISAIRQKTGQTVSALSYSPDADDRLCHRFLAGHGTPAVLVETSAGPSDSREVMEPRVQFALAALSGAIEAVPTVVPQERVASISPYVASADALAGRPSEALAAQPQARMRYTAAQITAARGSAVRLALALYLAACAVLIAVGSRTLASAFRRLIVRRRDVPARLAYVSIRARRYPPDEREKTGKLLAASVAGRNASVRCR